MSAMHRTADFLVFNNYALNFFILLVVDLISGIVFVSHLKP